MTGEQGITAELLGPAGAAAPTIERIAEEGGFDTVVVGSRGLGAVSRFMQGSVSEHVATHAAATVVDGPGATERVPGGPSATRP